MKKHRLELVLRNGAFYVILERNSLETAISAMHFFIRECIDSGDTELTLKYKDLSKPEYDPYPWKKFL